MINNMKRIQLLSLLSIVLFISWSCKKEPLELTSGSYPLTFKYEKHEMDPIHTLLITSDNKGEFREVTSPRTKEFEANLKVGFDEFDFDEFVFDKITLKDDSTITLKTKSGVLYENYRYNLQKGDDINVHGLRVGLRLDRTTRQIYQSVYGQNYIKYATAPPPFKKNLTVHVDIDFYKNFDRRASLVASGLTTNDTLFLVQFRFINKLN